MFYKSRPIDDFTHVPVPVAQYSSESEYNSAFTSGMALLMYSDVVPLKISSILDPCRICTSSMQKNGKNEKGGLNQGPWTTSLTFKQFASEFLHSVLHLIK